MHLDPIALAIPFFFLLIGIEVRVMRAQGRRFYRFADAITDLSCGIGSELARIFLGLVALALYTWVYERGALAHPPVWAQWAIGFIGLDFFYYWFHRFSHEVNSLWAMHVVHHQSQDYNLAVALRQSWFQGFAAIPFYFPLALLGVSPLVFAGNVAISLLYQFGLHTQTVQKLPGWFEAVFNTPSHHRVHHGINPQYIDRNHAGILIAWDKAFGTFEPEGATPVYGTVKPFTSWNPLWANFEYWAELWRRTKNIHRPLGKLHMWVGNPAWFPEELGGPQAAPPVDAAKFTKWDTQFPGKLKPYVNFHFVLVGVAVTALLLFQHQLPWTFLIAASSVLLLTTIAWGGLFEQKPWAVPLEWTRHALLALGALLWFGYFAANGLLLAASLAAVAGSGAWFHGLCRSREAP